MQKYILDTNILSYLEDKASLKGEKIYQRLSSLSDNDEVYIFILSYFEYSASLIYFENKKEAEDIFITQNLIRDWFKILNLKKRYSDIFASLRRELREKEKMNKKEIKLHTVDLLIASTAIVENAILVSNDKIFENIAELRSDFYFENWSN